MPASICFLLGLLCTAPGDPPADLPQLVQRTAAGRYVGVAANGALQIEAFLPGEAQTFALVRAEPPPLVLRDHRGRFFTPDEQAAELYRRGELPALLRAALTTGIQSAITEQLARKPYDKTSTRKSQTKVTLPAPTLRDLERKKTHTLVSVTTEYRLQAELDGQADIRFNPLLLLRNYRHAESRLLLVGVEAVLPIRGRVQYKLPDLASASTGYRTTVHLAAVADAGLAKSGDKLSFAGLVVRDIQVELRDLKLSNDVLQVVHRAIQDILNHELRENHQRVLEQANTALGKALAAREFQHPLLRWLDLP